VAVATPQRTHVLKKWDPVPRINSVAAMSVILLQVFVCHLIDESLAGRSVDEGVGAITGAEAITVGAPP
jgi:hypothetical protein